MWNKLERVNLTAEARLAFDRQATGPCLPKGNKLSLPSFKTSGDKVLATVENVYSQLKVLGFHVTQFDMRDVMHIVIPVNVEHTMRIENKWYDLLEDYHELHPEVVANSCTWYNRWVTNAYIRENMVLAFMLLQNNTDPELWAKCMELYEDYSPIQQGGPLMLCLILRRIQDQSEQALDYLKQHVSNIRLNKLEGEDIEQAVRLIKSVLHALKNASTKARSCAPLDFTKTVFNVLQTSSAPEFNDVFLTQYREIQTKADMDGTSPVWPDTSKVLALATNTHQRLKHSGVWDGVVHKSRALTYHPSPTTTTPSNGSTNGHNSNTTLRCWNCNGDHHLKDCPKPLDQAKIDAARARFRASRRSRGKTKCGTGSDGKPLVLNKNGFCVLDQKAWKAQQAEASNTSNQQAPRGSAPSSNVSRADAVRTALRSGLQG